MDDFLKKIDFPYETVRKGQAEFIKKVYNSIKQNKNLLVSAPTGLGKTISALAPAIKIAKEKNLTIVFLTSRQTQANQAIKTLKDIENKSTDKRDMRYVPFIGKRSMCIHPGKEGIKPNEFNEFCTKMKKTGRCKFYKNSKDENFEDQITQIIDKSSKDFMSVEEFVSFSGTHNFCPYEIAGKKAFKSDVVICDYNYMFQSGILEAFLGKIGRTLEECIIIVDEGHNLPDRIRNSYSYVLSTQILKNALSEIKDYFKLTEYDDYVLNIKSAIEDLYFEKILGDKKDYLISKIDFIEPFLSKFKKETSIKDVVDKLKEVEAKVKEDRLISFAGRVAGFLEKWDRLDEESYLRILEKDVQRDKTIISIKIKCIDPSQISSKILNNSHSSILMSATLSPINMYKDILGVENYNLLELDSPFEKNQQLTLVVNDVTSKYSQRTAQMYGDIANHIKDILSGAADKNSIIFFPSYDFMERVLQDVNPVRLGRIILKEQRYMTKDQKEEIVEKFKSVDAFNNKAKVLFAITSGSFSEGLDLPNKFLELVVVVGLPLGVPDLFTQAVIRHFDKKFRKGQMYGYVYPAMNKIIQAAGRCIRTENDRGVIVLMDNRFMWPLYAQTFPISWNLEVSKNPKIEISNFFNEDNDPLSF